MDTSRIDYVRLYVMVNQEKSRGFDFIKQIDYDYSQYDNKDKLCKAKNLTSTEIRK